MSVGDYDNSVHVSLAFATTYIMKIFPCAILVIFIADMSLWFHTILCMYKTALVNCWHLINDLHILPTSLHNGDIHLPYQICVEQNISLQSLNW